MSAHDGPLRNAANNGEPDRVSELLCLGANPNAPNKHGDTALVLSANNGHVEVVRLLLQHGADPSLHGHERMTPLGAAITNRHHEVVELLLQSSGHLSREGLQDGLSWAIICAEPAIVAALLKVGADPTPHGENGKTALDVARAWLLHAQGEFRLKFKEIITILEQHIAEERRRNA
jgi:ankyrin repeat protein